LGVTSWQANKRIGVGSILFSLLSNHSLFLFFSSYMNLGTCVHRLAMVSGEEEYKGGMERDDDDGGNGGWRLD